MAIGLASKSSLLTPGSVLESAPAAPFHDNDDDGPVISSPGGHATWSSRHATWPSDTRRTASGSTYGWPPRSWHDARYASGRIRAPSLRPNGHGHASRSGHTCAGRTYATGPRNGPSRACSTSNVSAAQSADEFWNASARGTAPEHNGKTAASYAAGSAGSASPARYTSINAQRARHQSSSAGADEGECSGGWDEHTHAATDPDDASAAPAAAATTTTTTTAAAAAATTTAAAAAAAAAATT